MAINHHEPDINEHERHMMELNKVLDHVDAKDIDGKLETDFEFAFLATRALFSSPSTKATIPREDATRFLQLVDGQHILAHDWEHVRKVLRAESSTKLDLIFSNFTVFTSLMQEVIEAGRPFWSSEQPSEHSTYDAMKSAPFHVARVLGVFDENDKRDALSVWAELEDQVPEQGRHVWAAIQTAAHAVGNPERGTINKAMSNVYTSKPVVHQVSLLIKLVDYVGYPPVGWPEGLEDPL